MAKVEKKGEMPSAFVILACTEPVQVHVPIFTDLINAPQPSTKWKNSISTFPGFTPVPQHQEQLSLTPEAGILLKIK